MKRFALMGLFAAVLLLSATTGLSINSAKPATPPAQVSPASQPTDRTSDLSASLDAANNEVKIAAKGLADAKADAIARLKDTQAHRTATADADAKLSLLEAARRGDDPAAKLQASRNYNKSREIVQRLEADAIAHDPKVQEEQQRLDTCEKLVRKAHADLDAERAAEQDRIEHDPIHVAIREHRLEVGMTVEQANMAIGGAGRKTGADAQSEIWEWPIIEERQVAAPVDAASGFNAQVVAQNVGNGKPVMMKMLVGRYHALVSDGKIVSYTASIKR